MKFNDLVRLVESFDEPEMIEFGDDAVARLEAVARDTQGALIKAHLSYENIKHTIKKNGGYFGTVGSSDYKPQTGTDALVDTGTQYVITLLTVRSTQRENVIELLDDVYNVSKERCVGALIPAAWIDQAVFFMQHGTPLPVISQLKSMIDRHGVLVDKCERMRSRAQLVINRYLHAKKNPSNAMHARASMIKLPTRHRGGVKNIPNPLSVSGLLQRIQFRDIIRPHSVISDNTYQFVEAATPHLVTYNGPLDGSDFFAVFNEVIGDDPVHGSSTFKKSITSLSRDCLNGTKFNVMYGRLTPFVYKGHQTKEVLAYVLYTTDNQVFITDYSTAAVNTPNGYRQIFIRTLLNPTHLQFPRDVDHINAVEHLKQTYYGDAK